MVKFLVASDVHGNYQALEHLVTKYQNEVNGIFYNGDSEFAADDPIFENVFVVKGNMDYAHFPIDQQVTLAGYRIYQCHGHEYAIRSYDDWAELSSLNRYANFVNAQIVLFGHTHYAGSKLYDKKVFINPGSLNQPRYKYLEYQGTYAIVNIVANLVEIKYYDINDNEIKKLHASYQL